MKEGLEGFKTAQMIRIVTRTMKRNIMIPQKIFLKRLCFFPLWWLHSFTDMVLRLLLRFCLVEFGESEV